MTVMSITLGMFFVWHVWIASRGMTTNECAKWDQVQKWHKKQKTRYEEAIQEGLVTTATVVTTTTTTTTTTTPSSSSMLPTIPDNGDVTCTGAASLPKQQQQQQQDENKQQQKLPALVDPGKMPKNIYDLGFVENWKEVLYPRSRRPDAMERFRRAMRDRKVTVTTTRTDTTTTTTTITHYPPPPSSSSSLLEPNDSNKPKANNH
eukprot:CAMPEP_0116542932 /NCGR_PEP_ID=MMETSP0397-20121206/1282_1 /TAXON_ID=216820 /ORGANISM="Cyclophora tenuis, Strain ECT3854" /LENGTH=204 /DNA_ID=CAMNT_0004066979 /DNA_START=354 /DNA_END=966 /DNA_ORIENTATION=-